MTTHFHQPIRLFSATAALLITGLTARAELTVCNVFSDHMVLQREKPVSVWGRADPGDQVSIEFAGQTATATAGKDGKWFAKLKPMKAVSEGQDLTITAAGDPALVIRDVLVGEVWLASGQSNMEWKIANSDRHARDLLAADQLPALRVFKVKTNHTWQPQTQVEGRWLLNDDKDALSNVSGIAYFFARQLQLSLGVPVGLIQSAEGGSHIEVWTNPAGLLNQPEAFGKEYIEKRKLARGDDPEQSGLTLDRKGTGNYEAMIAPLAGFTLRGFIWHQGEGNSQDGDAYRLKLHGLIHGWRTAWQDNSLYFAIGQLFAYDAPYHTTWEQRKKWAATQFAQYQAGEEIDRAGCIVLTDLSDPCTIHPQNKSEAGQRYARWALASVYGREILPGGPRPVKAVWNPETSRATLTFRDLGEGITSLNGHDLDWFEFGDDKGTWVNARVYVSDDRQTIDLWNWEISRLENGTPTRVRHAWMNIAMSNFANSDKVPATVFEIPLEPAE